MEYISELVSGGEESDGGVMYFPSWWTRAAERVGIPPAFLFFLVGFAIWGYQQQHSGDLEARRKQYMASVAAKKKAAEEQNLAAAAVQSKGKGKSNRA